MRLRLGILGVLFIAGFLAIVARLFYWQIVKSDDLSEQARAQHVMGNRIDGSRGSILAKDGSVLAASADSWTIFANLNEIEQEGRKIANSLAEQLVEGTEEEYQEKLFAEAVRIEGLLAASGAWIPLARRVDGDTKRSIEELGIEGIGFEREERRVYPEASASAHVLGFLGKDEGGENVGYFGLEGYYDLTISGRSGLLERERDALGTPILFGLERAIAASRGVDLLSHIDKTIQLVVEESLRDGIERYGANHGNVIVMEPTTGAVLAMAAFPAYDPANYFEYGDSLFRNPVISDAFEPGSIFKPIVMAAGLDSRVVKPETKCEVCGEPLQVDKYFIKTWNNQYAEGSTMIDVIKNSDNVGMAFVGQKIGAENLYDYLRKFGFGEIVGIDLQGEASPKMRERGTWNVVDLATASFGQGIAVTPIQMTGAIAGIANDGVVMRPQVVDKLIQDGWEHDIKPEEIGRAISKKAANQITDMMVTAVKDGEAKWAVPSGFKIAGKTGTAQIPVAGHYDEEKTIASFVGFAPADKPKFVMLVTLREPQSSPWASETAAPLWFDIALDLFPYLGVHPEN